MASSEPKIKADGVRCTHDLLEVTLTNGLILSTPLSDFPRLQKGTSRQRNQWELICAGTGIHWEALDEDISVAGLLKNFLRHVPVDFLSDVSPTRAKSARKYKASVPSTRVLA
jgi:hypothetical protein